MPSLETDLDFFGWLGNEIESEKESFQIFYMYFNRTFLFTSLAKKQNLKLLSTSPANVKEGF